LTKGLQLHKISILEPLFMHLIDIEICSNCGREIARLEQAYVFAGKIVCAECDRSLRSISVAEPTEIPEPPAAQEPENTTESQLETPSPSRPQEKEKQDREEKKSITFIIAGVILCLTGMGLIGLGLVGLAVSFFEEILIGILAAGWLLILGMLIIISGIAAIVADVFFHNRSLR
jgi:hypothetical protein